MKDKFMANKRNILKIILVASLIAMVYNIYTSTKLPDGMDKDEIEAKSKEIIFILNKKDTEGFIRLAGERLKKDINDQSMSDIYRRVDAAGQFDKIQNTKTRGDKDDDTKEDYAVATVRVIYENEMPFYTLTFNKDLELVGFHLQ